MQILIDKEGRRFVGIGDVKRRGEEIFHVVKDKFSVGGRVVATADPFIERLAEKVGKADIEIIADEDFERKQGEEGSRVFTAGTPREIDLTFSEPKSSQ